MDPQLDKKFFEIEERVRCSVGTRPMLLDLIERLPKGHAARVVDIRCGAGVMLREPPSGWGRTC